MSTLRNYDSDTSINYTDEHSYNISESDNVSQTHSTTKDIALQDQRAPIEEDSYLMILEGDYLCRWFGSYPHDLKESIMRLKLEYWHELIGSYNHYTHIKLYLDTAKEYCVRKKYSADIDRKQNRYYTAALGHLKGLKPRPE